MQKEIIIDKEYIDNYPHPTKNKQTNQPKKMMIFIVSIPKWRIKLKHIRRK